MRPENQNQPNPRSTLVPQPRPISADKSAAANVVRSQIDALYTSQAAQQQKQQTPQPAPTHTPTSAANPQADHMRQYHTAWQSYYQQYYQRYYSGHVHKLLDERASLAAQAAQAQEQAQKAHIEAEKAANNGIITGSGDHVEPGEMTAANRKAALGDLRQNLIDSVQESAKKARKSRHFIPIVAAISVVVVFSFLQYNRVLISNVQAYISPGSVDPQNIVVDPTADAVVGPDSKLIIPKINVDVPAIYGVGNDHDSQMKAMEGGVAHFSIPGASSVPGQIGNTILSGHSSNDIFDPGDYKFIFAQLDKLTTGDTIYTHYEGKRYTYNVTKKEVVLPTQVDKLTYATDKPVLTLITCTPLGTSQKRLLITAEQISPDPSAANQAPTQTTTSSGTGSGMPGNSQTLLERLFGN